ncbi:uncharacterized protein LOC123529134 [Mercenaria mercenaria]|uniref:uncharacterized protein LOC123529134 n=1 Tax=Mercenaria mercenaria TaxID=6596 RepID=UPI00234E46C7|nr:uncharacterized protein LOC123529134 [Mercenaria mercenaria]
MTALFLLGALCVALCASAVPSDEIPIDGSAICGETKPVAKEGEFTLLGTGNSSTADCSFMFTAESVPDPDCTPALCYLFDIYAFFEDPKASLSIESGTEVLTYNNKTETPRKPVCTSHKKLTVIMREEAGYVFNPKKPKEAYKFRMVIYHKCGAKGSVQNTKFEDAIQHAKGYHRAEERENRENKQFVSGILLGFGLASMFLVVLLIAYCYTRNSPNRPPGRSVGMPKVGGFKKKMKPNEPSGHKEVEMGVGYKAQDPEAKPESEALLTRGASDPEKPPLDTATVDEVDEKKPEPESEPEPEQVEKDLEKTQKAVENVEKNETNAGGDNSGSGDTNTGADNNDGNDAGTTD